jgi:hypothetical protein
MELKNQVCSLELAKRLKELGVKQESVWAWYEGTMKPWIWISQSFDKVEAPPASEWRSQAAAFTVAELGEMLPWHLRFTKRQWMLLHVPEKKLKKMLDPDEERDFILIQHCSVWKDNSKRHSCYFMEDDNAGMCIFNQTGNDALTEADARAKMLIYLIENKLVKLG